MIVKLIHIDYFFFNHSKKSFKQVFETDTNIMNNNNKIPNF